MLWPLEHVHHVENERNMDDEDDFIWRMES